MGHAIAYHYLRTGPNWGGEYWRTIEDLYQWTRSQYETSSSRISLVPDNFMVFLVGHGNGRLYALENAGEFFAEWVREYLYYHLTATQPVDPHFMARSRIMDRFFGRDGLNPAAFSAANLRAEYRSAGDEISFSSSSASPVSDASSVGGDIRFMGTVTGQGQPGGEFMIGFASTSDRSLGMGGDVLVGLQGSSIPDTYGPQALLGGELSFRTPMAPVRFELFGRGGGFHFLLGGSYFLDFGDIRQSTPRFGLGIGLSPHSSP